MSLEKIGPYIYSAVTTVTESALFTSVGYITALGINHAIKIISPIHYVKSNYINAQSAIAYSATFIVVDRILLFVLNKLKIEQHPYTSTIRAGVSFFAAYSLVNLTSKVLKVKIQPMGNVAVTIASTICLFIMSLALLEVFTDAGSTALGQRT